MGHRLLIGAPYLTVAHPSMYLYGYFHISLSSFHPLDGLGKQMYAHDLSIPLGAVAI